MNLATIMSCSSDNDPKPAANKAKRVNLQLTNSQKKEYIMKGELEGMDKDCLPDISTVRKWDPYRIEAFNSLGFGGEKRIRCATKTEKVDKLAEQLELSGECQLAFRHHILVTEELPEKMNHGPAISPELPNSDDQSGVDNDIYDVVDWPELIRNMKKVQHKNNADLLANVLIEVLAIKQNDLVVDGTFGEGNFWNKSTLSHFSNTYFFDMFKHNEDFPHRYPRTLPLTSAISLGETRSKIAKKVKVWVDDFPYAPVVGGHNLTNSNWPRSISLMRKLYAYGVNYQYTENQILFMCIDGFKRARGNLMDGGFYLIKAANFSRFDLAEMIPVFAHLFGFKSHPSSPSILGDDSSRLLYYQWCGGKRNKTLSKMLGLESDVKVYEKIITSAKNDYKEAILKYIKKSIDWAKIGINMKKTLPDGTYEHATQNVPRHFKDWSALLGCHLSSQKIASHYENLQNRNDINLLQNVSMDLYTVSIEMANITGLLWEQVLLQNGIAIADNSDENLKRKCVIERMFVPGECKITLCNIGSHHSLSENVKIYNDLLAGKNLPPRRIVKVPENWERKEEERGRRRGKKRGRRRRRRE